MSCKEDEVIRLINAANLATYLGHQHLAEVLMTDVARILEQEVTDNATQTSSKLDEIVVNMKKKKD